MENENDTYVYLVASEWSDYRTDTESPAILYDTSPIFVLKDYAISYANICIDKMLDAYKKVRPESYTEEDTFGHVTYKDINYPEYKRNDIVYGYIVWSGGNREEEYSLGSVVVCKRKILHAVPDNVPDPPAYIIHAIDIKADIKKTADFLSTIFESS